MHFFLSRKFATVAALVVTIGSSDAALTPEDISTAVQSPAGMTWSISDPSSPQWTVGENAILLGAVPTGAVIWIEATVSGPGVAGLDGLQSTWGLFKKSVRIDGVQSGVESTDGGGTLAEVGPGVHTIRWQYIRTSQPDYSGNPKLLQRATWEPFTEMPLSSALAGEGVTLTSPGPNPWIGQDARHHGDGAAAWSRLKIDGPPAGQLSSDAPLRATFEGPGVLSFWQRTYGYGRATVRFDNGSEQYVYSDAWTRTRRLVSAGPHVAEWSAGHFDGITGRGSFEMAVDEIQLLSLVPYEVALDTPGREWTAAPASGDTTQPYGILDPGASGGSMVTGFGTSISTPLTGQSLVKIRSRGNWPYVSFDDEHVSAIRLKNPDEAGWEEFCWAAPAGDTLLKIYGAYDLEIDTVEIVPPPSSLATTLGLAEGSFSTGGPDEWAVAPYEEIGGFGVSLDAANGHDDSWLEMPVQGPAEVSFFWRSRTYNYNRDFTVLVDGKEIDALESYGTSRQVRLAIPAGDHTVRWVAHAPRNSWISSNNAMIGEVKVSHPLPNTGDLFVLGLDQPLSTAAAWFASETFSRDGTPALHAPELADIPPDTYAEYEIKTRFNGPGKLSFWWYAGAPEGEATTADWSFGDSVSGDEKLRRGWDEPAGWRQEKIWLPPGDGLFRWRVSGQRERVTLTALDQVEFVPSAPISLGEAVDLPSLEWTSSTLYGPWTGFVIGEPSDDVALSPALADGESAAISTVVQGPGTVTFRWREFGARRLRHHFEINGVQVDGNYLDEETMECFVPFAGPVTLSWIAEGWSTTDGRDSWVGLDGVVWTPPSPSLLDEALDTPSNVEWKTSPGLPFTGIDDAGAVGGSSAFVALLPLEEAWLEATVRGPGLFDFWIREVADVDLSWDLWEYWSLTIDGKEVAISGITWPAQWITGDGPHKIRLTLRNPEWSNWGIVAGAVDQVSWQPLKGASFPKASGLSKNIWRVDSQRSPQAFTNIGRDGGPGIVLRPEAGKKPKWFETTVKGPCELSWESSLNFNYQTDEARNSVMVDGQYSISVGEHDWMTWRLTLPAGTHVVRWNSEAWYYGNPGDEPQPVAFDSMWKISGMRATQGISPLAAALDAPALYAVECGDSGGSPVPIPGGTAWSPGPDAALFFFNPPGPAKMTVRWGHPNLVPEAWTVSDGSSDRELRSSEPGWHSQAGRIVPEGFACWRYLPDGSEDPASAVPLLDSMVIDSRKLTKTLASALDSKLPLMSGGWLGIADKTAVSGKDLAWSLLAQQGESHETRVDIPGPANISYWWKKTSGGNLRLKVDGAVLPVPAAGESWTKVEFRLNPGSHLVEWIHEPSSNSPIDGTVEAWWDKLEVKKAPARSLSQAASIDPAVVLGSTTTQPEMQPWQPVAYKNADGTWTEAARAVSGSRTLTTTVEGPLLLGFRGRCFEGILQDPAPTINPSSVIIVIPGDRETVLGYHLSVEVDGLAKMRIAPDSSGAWQDGLIHIPSGTHQVTFRLMSEVQWLFGTKIVDALNSGLQGWIDDVRTVPVANHYADWVSTNGLPTGLSAPDDDADGDGMSNKMEYAFGTLPLDITSKLSPLEFTTVFPTRGSGGIPAAKIPFLLPHVSARLESSADSILWEPYPVTLRYFANAYSAFENGYDTATHQVFPILPGPGSVPYRLRLDGMEFPEIE